MIWLTPILGLVLIAMLLDQWHPLARIIFQGVLGVGLGVALVMYGLHRLASNGTDAESEEAAK